MTVDGTQSLQVPNAMVLGAGIGLTLGAALGGTTFIAPGILLGAGVGLIIGAATAAHRSTPSA